MDLLKKTPQILNLVVVCALLMACNQHRAEDDPPEIIRLKGVVEVPGTADHMGLSQCHCISDKQVIVLTPSVPELYLYDRAQRTTICIARFGEGPGDLNSRFNFMSVAGDSIFIHGLSTQTTSLFIKDRFLYIIHHNVPVISSIVFPDRVVASVHVPPDPEAARALGINNMITVFTPEVHEGTHYWKTSDGYIRVRYSGYHQIDYMMGMFWRLCPLDKDSYYRIPFCGLRTIEVRSLSGSLLQENDIPTDRAMAMEKDITWLANKKPSELITIKDAHRGQNGSLHILVPSDNADAGNNDGDSIMVMNKAGNLLCVYALDHILSCFDIDPDGDEFIGIDAQDGSLLSFKRP